MIKLKPECKNVHYYRCLCEHCCPQDTPANRYCCREELKMLQRIDAVEDIKCITQHPGYSVITENVYVLEVAYIDYRTENEPLQVALHK